MREKQLFSTLQRSATWNSKLETTVLDYLLFALIFLGHGFLLMSVVNYVYALPLHKHFLRAFRAMMGLLIFGLPIAFVIAYGVRPADLIRQSGESPSQIALTSYLVLVLTIGTVVLPLITLQRNIRPRPAQIIAEQTTTVDVAAALGARPYGDGESAWMAKLPFNFPFHVDFTTLTLSLPNMPPTWDGLTLLHLSDLHFFGTPAKPFFEFIVDKCMADGVPDLLMISGDIVDTDEHIDWIPAVLGKLRWKLGAFAIMGNHDWWYDFKRVRAELGRLGMTVVSGKWVALDVRGQKLIVMGHEGPWFKEIPDLSSCPADGFRLLLSHTPDNIRWAQRNHISLMLCGHNHGGQVRLPVFGSIFVPSKFSRRFDMGTFFEPPTLLHVVRGLSGKEPIRFRCNPQVTRIVLTSPNSVRKID
jgi:predicted MPP superfamily phosphohydrolase